MRINKTILLLVVFLCLAPLVARGAEIVVENADSVWSPSLTAASSDVTDSTDAPTGNLITEAFVSHADSVWSPSLTPASSDVTDSTDAPTGNLITEAFVSHADSVWSVDLQSSTSSGELEVKPTPPRCVIELQKDGKKITEINVGEFFDIHFPSYFVGTTTSSVTNTDIQEVRFLSDEEQNGEIDEGFSWTEDWYNWNATSGPWYASDKIMRWSFATAGEKEVWAEVMDTNNTTSTCSANISANYPSFVHMTDVHLGGNWLPRPWHWSEKKSYPRFTDALYEIGNMSNKPDFILIGGDNVEYNEEKWFEDFMLITDSFTQKFDIPVYIIPGNHDRYTTAVGRIHDGLKNYFQYIDPPGSDITEDNYLRISKDGNYKLEHNGYFFQRNNHLFIGLDSGRDAFLSWVKDLAPEGTGLINEQINALRDPDKINPTVPKVIFMHHPALNIEDKGVITKNRSDFIDYCEENEVRLVLSGHTHEDHIFNAQETELSLPTSIRPLFIQTPSATKDTDKDKDDGVVDFYHGYRIVDIEDENRVNPRSYTKTGFYPKILGHLDTPEDLIFRASDPNDPSKYITTENNAGLSIPFLFATSESPTKRFILYEYNKNNSMFEVTSHTQPEERYDLEVELREENVTTATSVRGIGFEVTSSFLRIPFSTPFLETRIDTDNNFARISLGDFKIQSPNDTHQMVVDWKKLIDNGGKRGVILKRDSDGDGVFEQIAYLEEMPDVINIDVGSPVVLQVYDSQRRVTGIVNGGEKEEIPYSIYDAEGESVRIYSKKNSDDYNYQYKVIGVIEGMYDLSIILEEENAEGEKEQTTFIATDIPTTASTTHQYTIDWDVLSRGENGVTLQIDADGDGIFEETITADATLQPPTADAGESYFGDEGSPIILDASGSTDADGEIALYEWDFDGDGIYEASSTIATTTHIWGDDYVGTTTLRITDDEGLTDVDTAKVAINNVAPTIEAGPDQTVNEGDIVSFSGSFTDPGWLDTHTIEWDFGDGETATGTLAPTYVYGDDGVYTVTLNITDDDGGVGSDTLTVTVNNLAPSLTLDVSEAISYAGGDAFVGRKGVEQKHRASATDSGSDDLTFDWSFNVTTTYYNNGTSPDPYPSPGGIFPFTAEDTARTTFALPGLYDLGVEVADDDGGVDSAEFAKIVTGDYVCARSQGFWKHQFGKGKHHIGDEALRAYLDIANFGSAVFSEQVPASTLEEAGQVMWFNKDDDEDEEDEEDENEDHSEMRPKAQAQLLAAWLNYASGAIGWDEIVRLDDDDDDEETIEMPFHQIMSEAEAILLNPEATHNQLEYAKDLTEAVNEHNEDSEMCEDIDEESDEESDEDESNNSDNPGKAKGRGKKQQDR